MLESESLINFRDGPNLRKVVDMSEFEGTQGNAAEFQATKNKFLFEIETALQRRFADFSSPTVLQSIKFADIQMWPITWGG